MTDKALKRVAHLWGKVGLGEVPTPDETRGNLEQADAPRRKTERTAQLNLRIRPEEKDRINIIAVRERVNINEVFTRMLNLYEREHGRAQLASPGDLEK